MKKRYAVVSSFLILILTIGLFVIGYAEPVVNMQYVYLNYVGQYTGQTDTGGIPFGFGVFTSQTAVEGEQWHYIGQWMDGLPEGEGAIYYENGNMEKGYFVRGILAEGLKYTVSGLAAVPVQTEKQKEATEAAYIGNKKSMKFHYPDCRSVKTMKESNKVEFSSREEAIERHFVPCGDCKP